MAVNFSNKYPYTDFHEINLEWVINEVKYWSTRVGKTIQSIELTGTTGLVDTYTINYSDGTTSTFDVTNGNGIASIEKTETAGLVDTYTITFQDGSTTTFEVHNGAVSVDDTLTRSGWAADAAAVGYQLSHASSTIVAVLDIIPNSQVTSSTGDITASSVYSRCDFTDLQNCISFTLGDSGGDANYINYCLYDVNYAYITGSANNLAGTHIRPDNAKYIIFTARNNSIQYATLTLNDVPSVVGGIYNELNKKVEPVTIFNETVIDFPVLLDKVIGVNKQPGNLVDPSTCKNGVYIDYRTGGEGIDNGYFATGYIPVTAGETYKSNVGRNYAWYDSNKLYLSGSSGVGIQSGITAPASAAYIRFTVNKVSDSMDDPYNLYFTLVNTYDNSIKITGLVVDTVRPWCYGKKINWIGDSIVDGQDFDEEVCAALGLVKQSEYGINGSTIALAADGTDGRNALCVRYADMSDDADIIAVSCGTNDFMYAWCPIGDINSTQNNTFYGALKTLCAGLINKYPNKLIFFTTPIKRAQPFENGDGGTYTPDGIMTTPFSKNKYGLTLGEYGNIIKEVCGYYSIPVLDMYNESMLNPHITSQQYLFDSALTHPNTTGQKIMARRVAGWMTQLGYKIN